MWQQNEAGHWFKTSGAGADLKVEPQPTKEKYESLVDRMIKKFNAMAADNAAEAEIEKKQKAKMEANKAAAAARKAGN